MNSSAVVDDFLEARLKFWPFLVGFGRGHRAADQVEVDFGFGHRFPVGFNEGVDGLFVRGTCGVRSVPIEFDRFWRISSRGGEILWKNPGDIDPMPTVSTGFSNGFHRDPGLGHFDKGAEYAIEPDVFRRGKSGFQDFGFLFEFESGGWCDC